MKLDIGAGTNPREGHVAVDPYVVLPWGRPHVQARGHQLPFPDESVDAVWSSHMLEHITAVLVPLTLAEWWRVLRVGGRLTLRVPDLEWCVQWWLDHQSDPWALAHIFGSQEHDGNIHRTGFTQQSIRALLVEAGFWIEYETTVEACKQPTLHFECVKRV